MALIAGVVIEIFIFSLKRRKKEENKEERESQKNCLFHEIKTLVTY
jgi:hypothetical protein